MNYFPFFLVENFLDQEHLGFCIEASRNLLAIQPNPCSPIITKNRIKKNGTVLAADILPEKIIASMHLRYHRRCMEMLLSLAPHKAELYDYSDFHIVVTPKNHHDPIHDDNRRKLLSGVVYLEPRINSGTYIYSSLQGAGKKEVPWRVNRGVFFSREGGQTWHSYSGDGINHRIALVYNLCSDNYRSYVTSSASLKACP